MMSRVDNLFRLYEILDRLEAACGAKRLLSELPPGRSLPRRGVYFFFEPGEVRSGSGAGPRLVRVGTHALSTGSRSTLHQRLRQHAGNASGTGGNHRGSIFRLLVGDALIARRDCPACLSWTIGSDIGKAAERLSAERAALAIAEGPLEAAVSSYLGRLLVLWLPIEDEPGPDSLRGFIERNTIALASSFLGPIIDPPSPSWLGRFSGREKVRRSGLWNQNHVTDECDASFLDALEAMVDGAADKPG